MSVFAQISMSLDGFVAGPNDGPGNGLGDGGERVHEWIVATAAWRREHGMDGGEDNEESQLVEQAVGRAGAVIMGRRMFDNGEEPWGPEPPFRMPVFVVTSREREPLVKGETTFTFVDGTERALELAREAAGGKDVELAGGGQIVSQYLAAGQLDEMLVHIAPVILGGGPRLFDAPGLEHVTLEPTEVLHSPRATHIRYRRAPN